MGETPSLLAGWSSFYIMTGSAAAGLTGLMFVVISIVTTLEQRPDTTEAGTSAFSTPTVIHFATALLVSAVLVAPWGSLIEPSFATGLIGLSGLAYLVRVAFIARHVSAYTPDLEDWIWFTVLPFVAYATIAGGAIGLWVDPVRALFVSAAGVLLLIFIGIRNAWDVVTWLAIRRR